MRNPVFFFTFVVLTFTYILQFHADAAPAGPLIKHLSSFLKWTRSSSKTPQPDGSVLQFETGYIVETVVEGNDLGMLPYKIRVSEDGELYAVDAVNSNIVKITPPLSQYSRARLVAGSFQGHTGHVDGKPSDARFSHPRGVTMDDKGNVYVADTMNLAIRKISDSGVTTIAGGKSNIPGYRDGPSEDAKFSSDFDVVYVRPTCSLLVVDRGNAALRQISLDAEDCDYQLNSISSADILMFVGAVLVGYATCMLQQGFGPFFFSRTQVKLGSEFKEQTDEKKAVPLMESVKDVPGWPSFGQLLVDLSKFSLEAFGSIFTYLVPYRLRTRGLRKDLTPLRDHLKMPEDEGEPHFNPGVSRKNLVPLKDSLRMPEDQTEPLRQSAPAPLSETRVAHNLTDKYTDTKPPKLRSTSLKDPLLSKRRAAKQQLEYAEFYASGEVPPYSRSKSHKEKSRHRQRDKSGEAVYAAEQKAAELKPAEYESAKLDHYNIRNKYGSDGYYRF